jgi:Carbamoyl-phosphate synthase L chain, ATP binding domain
VKPTILIVTTSRWFPTARLAMALVGAGCVVDAVCPAGHPLTKMRAVRRAYAYRGLMPLHSFAAAIAAAQPDFLVPGDDLATCQLHYLHARERRRGKDGRGVCELIERSLGAPESFPVVYARSEFVDMAREQGVRAPKTEVIANLDDVRKWVARFGLPTVLKANGTSGGEGVRVAHTLEEAERAFRDLQSPPLLARAAKRALVDQDKSLVWPSLLRRRSVVNAQVFVAGHEATSTVACWKGAVLASLHFEVVNKRSAAGQSSVLHLIENAEMSAAAEKMVRRLGLSGIHGFDFMLEAHTANAHLIEINPRATQVGHLALGPGRDLPAALYSAISGEPFQAAKKVTENDTITLFPQEWTRDPASPFLTSGYHDVPWEEPELLRACVRKPWKLNFSDSRQDALPALSTVRIPRS